MVKAYINLAFFTLFSFCSLPIYAHEDQNQTDQIEQNQQEQTAPVEEQQCPDLVAVNRDLQKVLIIAALVGLSWALIHTYKKLVDAKTHITELQALRLAEQLVADIKKEKATQNPGLIFLIGKNLASLQASFTKFISNIDASNYLPIL